MARTMAEVDAVFDLICYCHEMSVVKTRWYRENAGRRYKECRSDTCSYHKWIDPPLGARAVEAIKELQDHFLEMHEKYRRKLDRMIEGHEAQMNNLKNKQVFTVVAMFMVFAVMMSKAFTSVTPGNVAEDYDSDDVV